MSSLAEGRPRALLMALDDWAVGHHLAHGLTGQGFEVRALFPRGNVLRHSRFAGCEAPMTRVQGICCKILAAENRLGDPAFMRPLADAATRLLAARLFRLVARWRPDVLIPLDERAVRLCRDLVAQRAKAPAELVALLKRSLGDPSTLDQRLTRDGNYSAACAALIRVPRQASVTTLPGAVSFAAEVGYPVVVKRDNSAGGAGVTICPDEATLARAITAPAGQSWRQRAIGALEKLVRNKTPLFASVTIQQFVDGAPAMRELLCWDRRVIAGFSLMKTQSYPAHTGAASVVESIAHDEMAQAAAALAAELGLNGFADVDFVIERATGAAYCIELNPRPTGLTHLGTRLGCSLEAALLRAIQGLAPNVEASPRPDQEFAIFPKEWMRDPNSPRLRGAGHDVPWDDPEVVAFYCTRRSEEPNRPARQREIS